MSGNKQLALTQSALGGKINFWLKQLVTKFDNMESLIEEALKKEPTKKGWFSSDSSKGKEILENFIHGDSPKSEGIIHLHRDIVGIVAELISELNGANGANGANVDYYGYAKLFQLKKNLIESRIPENRKNDVDHMVPPKSTAIVNDVDIQMAPATTPIVVLPKSTPVVFDQPPHQNNLDRINQNRSYGSSTSSGYSSHDQMDQDSLFNGNKYYKQRAPLKRYIAPPQYVPPKKIKVYKGCGCTRGDCRGERCMCVRTDQYCVDSCPCIPSLCKNRGQSLIIQEQNDHIKEQQWEDEYMDRLDTLNNS